MQMLRFFLLVLYKFLAIIDVYCKFFINKSKRKVVIFNYYFLTIQKKKEIQNIKEIWCFGTKVVTSPVFRFHH